MRLRMKNFNMGIHWKIRFLRGRGGGVFTENQYIGENCLKRGAWSVCRFKGGLAKKREVVFLRGSWYLNAQYESTVKEKRKEHHSLRLMETLSDQWLCFFEILNIMASISVKAWGWWGHLATVRFRVSWNLFYCLLVLFRFPFFRDLFLSFGMCDVSKESIRHICTKEAGGNIAIIIVGGAAESLDARPGSCTITLKDRKGFIRMALLTGLVLFTKAESTKVTAQRSFTCLKSAIERPEKFLISG